jgi:hypothetical protein
MARGSAWFEEEHHFPNTLKGMTNRRAKPVEERWKQEPAGLLAAAGCPPTPCR